MSINTLRFGNTLRFASAGSSRGHVRTAPFHGVRAPSATQEYQALFAALAVALAGSTAVVLHALAVLGS